VNARLTTLALAALAAMLLCAAIPAGAGAAASAYQQVTQSYQTTGQVPVCRFSSAELEAALKEASPDEMQYYGDVTEAIQSTLDAQATGGCNKHRSGVVASSDLGGLRVPPPPADVTAGTGAGVPLPLVLLFAVAAAFAAVALTLRLARAGGWDPAWAASVRHTWGETEYRISGLWAEFTDWLRS
jgi:hypothetical protein